jgi:hypothetical protein
MNETFKLFLQISTNRMCEHYLPKLVKSLEVLEHKDLWKHESEHLNSIGGIVLHIGEHINRHIKRYSQQETKPGGIESHFPDEDIEPSELIVRISNEFMDWKQLMNQYFNKERDCNILDMNDIYHLVEHTSYHLGQIVDRIQRIVQIKFQFVQNGINEKNLKDTLTRSNH